jgi:hypothetical protein
LVQPDGAPDSACTRQPQLLAAPGSATMVFPGHPYSELDDRRCAHRRGRGR